MQTNKNILEVCLSPDLGGLELYMQTCAKELSSDFQVLSVINAKSRLKSYFENTSHKYIELQRKSSFSPTLIWRLANIIDTNDIDVIHFHWTKDLPTIVFAKLISKCKPKIVQTRHMTMTRFKSDFYHSFLYKNINTIICITKAVENQIHKFIPSKIRPKTTTLYLGAKNSPKIAQGELDELKNSLHLQNEFLIGFIGRINEFKGQHLLIEALRILKPKNLNIKAFIVGHPMEESYLESLRKRVLEYGLENMISFIGFTKEPYKFMQICDVMIMASKNETFGLVTIEAMKNQTAVIGSNSGGVLEIIDDMQTGILFENQNSVDLASKIELIYNNDNLKQEIALRGKEKADKLFDSEKHFRTLKDILRNLGD
jgi:glycosyltransferase involved in cell wall biosynthesis